MSDERDPTIEALSCALNHCQALNSDLLAALKYARRWLNEDDHDIAYVDSTIAKAEKQSAGEQS